MEKFSRCAKLYILELYHDVDYQHQIYQGGRL